LQTKIDYWTFGALYVRINTIQNKYPGGANMETAPNQNEIYQNIREIILTARHGIKKAVEFSMVQTYWQIGKQIMEAQGDANRAEYGAHLLKFLAEKLTNEFGVRFQRKTCVICASFIQLFKIATHCVAN
jgi:hypothetical protein